MRMRLYFLVVWFKIVQIKIQTNDGACYEVF